MYYGKSRDGSIENEADANNILSLESKDFFSHKAKPIVPEDLINHVNRDGWTAAHIAASKGFKVNLFI